MLSDPYSQPHLSRQGLVVIVFVLYLALDTISDNPSFSFSLSCFYYSFFFYFLTSLTGATINRSMTVTSSPCNWILIGRMASIYLLMQIEEFATFIHFTGVDSFSPLILIRGRSVQ